MVAWRAEQRGSAASLLREVPAEQEAVLRERLSQGHPPRGGLRARDDPTRSRAGQGRAEGHGELVEQPVRGDLAEQVRASLAEHPAKAAGGQGVESLPEIDVLLAGHDHVLSLIHISEPTRLGMISYAVFCLKKKKK